VPDLVVVRELEFGRERPARLGAEAFERADLLVAQELLDLLGLERTARGDLGDRELAAVRAVALLALAGEAAVVLLDDAAAVRARRLERGVVAGNRVAVVLLGLLDDALGHAGDVGHEGLARQAAVL